MRIIGILTTTLIIVIGIAFSVLNSQTVHVNYLIGKASMPLSILLLISIVTGMLIAFLIFGWNIIKLKSQARGLKSRLKSLEDNTNG